MIGLIACNQHSKNIFAEREVLIEKFKEERKLVYEIFLSEIYGYFDIVSLNDQLLLFSRLRENLFTVYDTQGDSIGSFGTIGQGPNELLNNRWTGQSNIDSTGNKIWINDVSNARLVEINITKSLIENHCVFEKIIKTPSLSINCFFDNDSILIIEQQGAQNYKLFGVNTLSNNNLFNQDVYLKNSENPFSIYKSIINVNSKFTKVLFVMQSLNMVNIFDIETMNRKSFVIDKSYRPMLVNALDRNTKLPKWVYYIDAVATTDRIYTLYLNQSYEESFAVEKEMEIHVFSWDGEALFRYKIDNYLEAIAVDEKNQYIYGLGLDEILYKYKID